MSVTGLSAVSLCQQPTSLTYPLYMPLAVAAPLWGIWEEAHGIHKNFTDSQGSGNLQDFQVFSPRSDIPGPGLGKL